MVKLRALGLIQGRHQT